MEDTPRALNLRERFPVVTAIQPGTRWQDECNAQTLSSFDTYDPSHAFPTAVAK